MSEAKGTHPSQEELAAFSSGRLNVVESDEVEKHLSECETCCEVLKNLPDDDTLVSLLRPEADTSTCDDVSAASPEHAMTLAAPVDDATAAPAGVTTDVAGPAAKGESHDLPDELLEHPRYRIVELLGRGGMGDVYRAEHKVMSRAVALKVIKPQLVQNDAAVRRFQREVRAAARLHHPNIVTAYDAEQAGDVHYLVMEFVDGVDLDEVIKQRGPIPVVEASEYIRQAAEGLQHAHELGMVHRDIKPHNLMVAKSPESRDKSPEQDSRAASLTGSRPSTLDSRLAVKILDFGLANFASETAAEEIGEAHPEKPVAAAEVLNQLTQVGTMMGTPDYIAPEQAKDAHTADIRADIYSLGCTFYTLLAGQAPFGEGSVIDKIKAHTQQEAPRLSEFRDDVPAEVETILQKMMAKDAVERYQTPAEVADAIQSLKAKSSASQGSEPKLDGFGEPSRGRGWPVSVKVAAALLGVILLGVIIYMVTDTGTVVVESASGEVELVILKGGREVKRVALQKGVTRIRLRSGEYTIDLRGNTAEFTLEKDKVLLVSRGAEVPIKIEARPTPRASPRVEIDDARSAIVEWLKELDAGDFAKCFEMAAPRLKQTVSQDFFVQSTAAARKTVGQIESREETSFTTGATGHSTHVTFAHRTTFQQAGEIPEIVTVSLEADGKWRVSGYVLRVDAGRGIAKGYSTSGQIQLTQIARLKGHRDNIDTLAYSPDGKYLFVGDAEKLLYQWDVGSRSIVRKIPMSGFPQAVVALSDGRHVITSTYGGEIKLWSLASGRSVRQFMGHTKPVTCLSVSPQDKRLLSAGHDGLVRLWNIETGEPIYSFEEDFCDAAVLSADGRLAAHGATGGGFRIWDTDSGKTLREILRESAAVSAAAFSPEGRFLVTGDGKGVIQVWDTKSGKQIHKFDTHENSVTSLVFTPDGRHVISGSFDQSIRFFDLDQGLEVGQVLSNTLCANHLAISPDGRILASGGGKQPRRIDGVWRPHKDGDYDVHLWRLPEMVRPTTNEMTEDDLNSLLVEATGIPNDEWTKLGTDPGGPNPKLVTGTPLSWVLLTLNPNDLPKDAADVRKDFRILTPNFRKLPEQSRVMWISKDKGYASMIQPEYITRTTITTQGGTARGTVEFEAKGFYAGRVEFAARHLHGKWRIDEFNLPNCGISVRLGADGKWQRVER